jgi:hypothetical protein
MRETAQVLILPTDEVYRCSILLNIAEKTRRQFAINRWRRTRLPARMDKSTISLLLYFLAALIGIAGVDIRVAPNTSRSPDTYIPKPEHF